MANNTERSLEAIWLLAGSSEPLTAGEFAAALGLGRTSAYRLLESLVAAGWVSARGRPQRYSASYRVAEVGIRFLRQSRVREVVLPYMLEMSQTVQAQTLLNFYEHGEVVITDGVENIGERLVTSVMGNRAPALRTASGKILLAYEHESEVKRVHAASDHAEIEGGRVTLQQLVAQLDETKTRGYGVADRELNANSSGFAVPLFDAANHAVAAIGIPVHGELTTELIERYRQPALDVAHRASISLGQRPANRFVAS